MEKIKVKCGAIVKEINKGTLKWYKMAGWQVLEEKNTDTKELGNDKTNS